MINHDKPRNPIRRKNHRRLGHVQNHQTSSETSPLLSGRFNLRRSKISGALSVAVRSLFGRLKKLRSKSTRRRDPGEDGCGFVSHTALLSVVAAAGIWTKNLCANSRTNSLLYAKMSVPCQRHFSTGHILLAASYGQRMLVHS